MADNNHEKKKKILKITGAIVFAIGLVCVIIGLADFFMSFSSAEMPSKFYLLFIGFPCCAVGGSMLLFGFKREITTYVKNESVPVFNEMGKEITPGISAISKAVKNDCIACPVCNEINDKDSKFCKKCGASLSKTCPNCHATVDNDSAFCDKCGTKLQ